MTTPDGTSLTERLNADLRSAIKARDRVAVGALRTALAALANAQAPAFDAAEHPEGRGELLEHTPLSLTVAEVRDVLIEEIRRREELLAEHEGGAGMADYLAELRAEVEVLRPYAG